MHITKTLANVALWAAIFALSIYFFTTDVFIYLQGFRSKNFGNSFFNNQVWVVSHLIGGTLALFLGPMQFWRITWGRYLNFHRTCGKIYIIGCLMVGVSALRTSLISSCVPCRISLFLTAVFLLITTLGAWFAIKNRNIKAHRQFMVRSYVLILAFVAVRIDSLYSLSFLFGTIEDSTFNRVVNEYFFSFVPLIITELFITWVPALKSRKTAQPVKR
jgi:uncharacterized membrane protein